MNYNNNNNFNNNNKEFITSKDGLDNISLENDNSIVKTEEKGTGTENESEIEQGEENDQDIEKENEGGNAFEQEVGQEKC